MRPSKAIVREPGDNYTKCISSHPQRRTIDVAVARKQHAVYRSTLEDLGLEVMVLPRDDIHPDSCFVEDNAVVFGKKALICRMAKESRRGEEADVEKTLRQYLKTKRASPPATIEGGDVMHLEDGLISGLTQRTNKEGTRQLAEWLEVKVDPIEDSNIVHLKSYVNYLGRGRVISTPRFASHPVLSRFEVIQVDEADWYSTNNIVIDDSVIMPSGFPTTEELLRRKGYKTIPLDMSEFPKCEGALTCLSILL